MGQAIGYRARTVPLPVNQRGLSKMAQIRMKQEHNLTRADARARVENVARDLKRKLNAEYQWKGDSLRFSRSGASGTINVGDDSIEVDVKLSMLLAPMKGKIEGAIKEQFEVAMAGDNDTKLA